MTVARRIPSGQISLRGTNAGNAPGILEKALRMHATDTATRFAASSRPWPRTRGLWGNFLCVAICRLSLFVENRIFDKFRHSFACPAGGIATDAVFRGKVLFQHVAQFRHGTSTLPNVVPHSLLDLLQLLWLGSARPPQTGLYWAFGSGDWDWNCRLGRGSKRIGPP